MKIAVLGASGRTGRLVVERALEKGHAVRALVRSPEKLKLTHERLDVVRGDATDREAVARVVEGTDAVVSALGPTSERKDVCSVATEHVIAASPRRYVVVSGAGLDVPGDRKDVPGKIISFLIRTISPALVRDKERELSLLQSSAVPFVLVRPPGLLDRPAKGRVRSSLERAPGASIPRADLAAFLLECVEGDAFVRKAPFVAG